MSRRSVGIIVVLLSLQVGERRKWMIIVPYSDYLLTWGNAANNVWRRQNRGAKIQLHQIKETLEHILSTEDLHKNSLLKIEVVRLLKLLRPIITPEEFRRIKLLAQLSLKAQENELNFLIDNPEERWEVIQEVIQLRETVYPPQQGWVTNYLDYVKLQESPIEFHFWVGVCLIGATLKRNVWFNKQDYYSVFPSQFVILVAKSSACKKSTAINIEGLRHIEEVYGGFSVSEDGADWYDQFYASNKINRSTDPNMSGYYERKPDHLIKLAMIIAVSEGI